MAKFTLNDLMQVTGSDEITIRGKKVCVYARTLSHAENDERQDYASAAARQVYRKLKDKESLEYKRYLGEIELSDRTELEELVLSIHKRTTLVREAAKEIKPVDAPEPPDDATVLDILETEEQNDQIVLDVEAERAKWIEEAARTYAEELKAWSVEQLCEKARLYRTEQVANAKFSDAWMDATIYYGIWADAKFRVRKFKSIEDVAQLDSTYREKLLALYSEADRFSNNLEELKN